MTFTDPVFGSSIRRVSNTSDAGGYEVHEYSQLQAFSADDAYLRPYAMLDAGILALNDGDLERACQLVSAAQRIFDETGAIPDPDDRVELDHAVASLRDKLSDRFDGLWAAGRALNFERAVLHLEGHVRVNDLRERPFRAFHHHFALADLYLHPFGYGDQSFTDT